MRTPISYLLKAAFVMMTGCLLHVFPVYSQQHIIANKDNTRPETTRHLTMPAKITSLKVVSFNGYNEIQWGAVGEQDTRRYIAEYTVDGVNYQTAGELAPFAGSYQLKHYTTETRPIIYRLRIEKKDGSFYDTDATLLSGTQESFVTIYPTKVQGDVINVNADFPAERAAIVGMEGQNIFSKELGGLTGSFTMAVPTLKKGVYWITFYGRGWTNTIPFLVAE
jgi:hypothetical protein